MAETPRQLPQARDTYSDRGINRFSQEDVISSGHVSNRRNSENTSFDGPLFVFSKAGRDRFRWTCDGSVHWQNGR